MTNKALNEIGPELIESNCFYSLYGLVDSADKLVYDWNNFVDPAGSINWFNLVGYNPVHILNNVTVNYEMCDVYTQFERLTGNLSGDWPQIGDILATDITYLALESKDSFEEITKTFTCPTVDDILNGDLTSSATSAVKDAIASGTTKFQT